MEEFLSSDGGAKGYTLNVANGVFFQRNQVNLEQAKNKNPIKFMLKGKSTIEVLFFG